MIDNTGHNTAGNEPHHANTSHDPAASPSRIMRERPGHTSTPVASDIYSRVLSAVNADAIETNPSPPTAPDPAERPFTSQQDLCTIPPAVVQPFRTKRSQQLALAAR